MGGGILNGTILGLLVSGAVLAAVSLSTPLPEQPVAAVPAEAVPEPDPAAARGADPAPEAAAEDAPAPAEDASSPAADPALETTVPETLAPEAPAPEAPAPEAPAEDPAPDAPEPEAALTPGPAPRSALAGAGAEAVTLAAPAAPTQTATLPRIDTPPSATLLAPRAAAPAQDSAPAQPAPVAAPSPAIATVPTSPAPSFPASAPSPRFSSAADGSAGGTPPRRLISPQPQDTLAGIDTEPAPAPPEPEPTPAPEPETAPEPGAAVRADPEPEPADPPALAAVPESEPEPVAPRQLPQVAAVPRGPAPATPAPSLASRLPQAGVPAMPEPEAAPEPEDPDPGPPNALADNAEAFDAPAGNPLLAVVLIDDPDSPIEPAALASLTFPVSFAIDPMRPDAGARAAELRAAGHEVVILGAAAIPDGAAPGDVEVALAVARETVPQAVALMDDAESRIQGDRPVLDATVGTLAESGHGLIAFPRGLNAAEETARRTGVPAVTVFRLLDDADQSAPVITRYLGRAAFAAAQDGAVVVVGHSRPDTVTALFSWALGSRTEGVDLAPVSAVLRRLNE